MAWPGSRGDAVAPAAWRRFAAVFACVAAGLFLSISAGLLALDPYDTGRFALVAKRGVPSQGPRTANASRGRDPAYDSAIIGNSRVQLLQPETLNAATGAAFVSLHVPGTGPREQIALLDYFMRQHRSPRILVLGIDGRWCTPDAAPPLDHSFPFWLYDESDLAFIRGLLGFATFERAQRRIRHLLGLYKPARADGYSDYEAEYAKLSAAQLEGLRRRLAETAATAPENPAGSFPFAARLTAELAKLPAQTIVVLVRPPTFVTGLPQPGTPAAAADAACHDAFARVAAARPRTAVVDWRTDRPENRAAEHFFDHTHYRRPLAEALERDIAAAVLRLSAVAAQ